MGMSGDFELAVWSIVLKLISNYNFLDGHALFDTCRDDDSVRRMLTTHFLKHFSLLIGNSERSH